MKSKTEEFLNFLLWSADKFGRPTFRNITDSYESWAYRHNLNRQAATLQEQQFIEPDSGGPDDRVYRLTKLGRLRALGGRDPQTWWSREWDGLWRLVLFDIPLSLNSRRNALRHHLRLRGFGCLQRSVWITPDRMDEERNILDGSKPNVKSLLVLEARPGAGEPNSDIVAGAWDFEAINARYVRLLKILEERPTGVLSTEDMRKALFEWCNVEREAWLAAVKSDPLLPARLLPKDYLGKTAWRRRLEVFRGARRQLQTFTR